MSEIIDIKAREILDSRGNPTVEVDVTLVNGAFGRAAVPSGASTGKYEAHELRDGDKKRYLGLGVHQACNAVNEEIREVILGLDAFYQRNIDLLLIDLDSTKNKTRLGANAILGVSMAVAKAAASSLKVPLYRYLGGFNSCLLPAPMMNIINGGKHADNPIDVQEFMIAPLGANTFREAVRYGSEIFHTLKNILKSEGYNINVGDEGGFAPNFKNSEEALDNIMRAIEKAGYKPGEDIYIALDAASTEFYENGKYNMKGEGKIRSSDEMIQYWENLVSKYPIYSIEDGLSEDDWDGWINLTKTLGKKIQLVGDDLFVTNPVRLTEGIKKKVGNSMLVKVNQIGTLTETFDAMELAHKAGYSCIVSHRSGETEDNIISDIAVAVNAGQIKTGSLSRTDRLAKYNNLIRIEEELEDVALFAGKNILFNK